MKILLVIDHLGPAGSQSQMVTLATTLKSRGHTVEVFIYFPNLDHFRGRLDDADIPVHGIAKRSKWDLLPLVRLRRIVAVERYDVAVSFLPTPCIYNVFATLMTTTKTVVSERSAFPTRPLTFRHRFRIWLYRLADHVVVNSRHHHAQLCAKYTWIGRKSSAITNGVDLTKFVPAATAPDRDGRTTILAVGSIHAGKNFGMLIEALNVYKETFGEPPLIRWVGREPKVATDILAYENAKDAIRRYGLEESWQWLGTRPDIPELLRQHDGFIHPSLHEGLPNAVCEALASGKPVLASNVCDHPWLVQEGKTGFLFDPLDPVDIARALRRFIELTPRERRNMGMTARAFAEKELAISVLGDAYEKLLASL